MIVFYCENCDNLIYYNEVIVNEDDYGEKFICPKCGNIVEQTSDY